MNRLFDDVYLAAENFGLAAFEIIQADDVVETRGREILTQAHNYVDIMRAVLATGDRAELRRAHYACCANDVVAVHGFILPEHSRPQVRTGPTPQGPPATHSSSVRRRRASGTKYTTDPPVLAAEIVSEDDRAVEIPQKLAEYHDWGVRHRPGCALGRSRSENEPVAYKILFTEDALLL